MLKIKYSLILKKIIYLTLFIFSNNTLATITINGEGNVNLEPNIATFTVNINTTAKTAKEAASKNSEQTNKTINILKSIIPEKKSDANKAISTQDYNLSPEYKWNKEKQQQELTGFTASNTLLVKTKNLSELGTILDKTISSGITELNNLSFAYDNPEEAYKQALDLAIANAKERADIIATASDIQIEGIQDITVISTNQITPSRIPMMYMATSSERNTPPTPIETPDVKTKAIVQVVFKN